MQMGILFVFFGARRRETSLAIETGTLAGAVCRPIWSQPSIHWRLTAGHCGGIDLQSFAIVAIGVISMFNRF